MRKELFALPLALTGVAIVAALAVIWAMLAPEKLSSAILGGLVLPVLWGGAELLIKGDKSEVRHAVIVAAALVALSIGVKIAQATGWLGLDEGRLVGIGGGLVMVYFGNRLPKILEHFDARIDGARRQAFQRQAGWAFVLAGLGSALAWAMLPLDSARLWGMVFIAGGVAVVLARLVQCGLRRKRA